MARNTIGRLINRKTVAHIYFQYVSKGLLQSYPKPSINAEFVYNIYSHMHALQSFTAVKYLHTTMVGSLY